MPSFNPFSSNFWGQVFWGRNVVDADIEFTDNIIGELKGQKNYLGLGEISEETYKNLANNILNEAKSRTGINKSSGSYTPNELYVLRDEIEKVINERKGELGNRLAIEHSKNTADKSGDLGDYEKIKTNLVEDIVNKIKSKTEDIDNARAWEIANGIYNEVANTIGDLYYTKDNKTLINLGKFNILKQKLDEATTDDKLRSRLNTERNVIVKPQYGLNQQQQQKQNTPIYNFNNQQQQQSGYTFNTDGFAALRNKLLSKRSALKKPTRRYNMRYLR